MVGETIAHYRIAARIGSGGMGEVYRATDTKLQRAVAIKVIPPAFASDPERMARFEREAQVLASLSHGSIAAVYGIEEFHAGKAIGRIPPVVDQPSELKKTSPGRGPRLVNIWNVGRLAR